MLIVHFSIKMFSIVNIVLIAIQLGLEANDLDDCYFITGYAKFALFSACCKTII